MTSPIRLLVVDDHRMFTDALRLLLAAEEGIEIIGVGATAEEGLDVASRDCPDVALMDVDLPGIDGIEGIRRLRGLCPEAHVVVITALQEKEVMAAAVEAGASGFVPKTQAADQLVGVIRRAVAGEMVLPSGHIEATLQQLQEARQERRGTETLIEQLTSREIEILQAFAEGRSAQETAEVLYLSTHTVKAHTGSILRKLRCRSKLQAVLFALRLGLVQLPSET